MSDIHIKGNRSRWLFVMGTILVLLGITVYITRAHIVPEQPWHPVSGAYLRSTFYLNLGPQIN